LLLTISRPLDAAGAPTAEGVVISLPLDVYDISGNTGSTGMLLKTGFLSAAMGAFNTALTPFVGGQAAAAAGGNTQIQRTYYLAPSIKANPALTLYWNTSMPVGDQFEAAVDGIARTYITLGNATGAHADAASGRGAAFAMLWGDL
jgi:hypothetical protein